MSRSSASRRIILLTAGALTPSRMARSCVEALPVSLRTLYMAFM